MATAGAPPPSPVQDQATEQMRIRYAFWLAVIGLVLAAGLVVFLVLAGVNKSSDVVAIVGLITSVLGTLIGSFFGLQVGSAGREKDQQAARRAESLAHRALAALPPEQARNVLEPLSAEPGG